MKDSNKEVLKILNKKNARGETALFRAIICLQPQQVKFLVDLGANIGDEKPFEKLLAIKCYEYDEEKTRDKIINILLAAHTKVTDGSIHDAIKNNIDKKIVLQMIHQCSTFRANSHKFGNNAYTDFFNWLSGADYCYSSEYLQAAVVRFKELNQLESKQLAIENLPTFFSQTKEIAAFKANVPNEYICPITLSLMKDPVLATDGFTYERKAIEAHFNNKNTSPMTNAPLVDLSLHTNQTLKNLIQNHFEQGDKIAPTQLNRSKSLSSITEYRMKAG